LFNWFYRFHALPIIFLLIGEVSIGMTFVLCCLQYVSCDSCRRVN